MQFATIHHEGALRFGLVEGGVLHLAAPGETLRQHLAGDLAALADRLRAAPALPLDGIRYAPVIPDAPQVFCIGLNYRDHRAETAGAIQKDYPKEPIVFARWATSLAGHGEDLPKPANSDSVDFEAELAVIIGKGGRHIARAQAMEHVAGYACFNDISMRDWQMKAGQWTPGKNFPKSGPLGPVMVTPEAVGPLDDLTIRCLLDGAVMQESTLGHLLFDIPTLIAYCSEFAELQPGDVIATGTPGGVGFVRKPPVLLEPGKRVVVEIERVGRLENAIVAE
ncbi:fumarylacetoacetate hydrolase family protein [Pararhodobacter sp.]|uniref:fumarylacetoacetate hydrolase family protein n=1 Tax=Pararhodobacter sp. TaxID=2127056 RepID=UPI002AFDDFBF|nr:fumarylacetoacetate hydrolase family protein [Pararhodobacter sp.]